MRVPAMSTVVVSAVVVSAGCGYPTYGYVDGFESLVDASTDAGDDAAVEDTTSEGGTCGKPNGCGGCDDQGVAGTRCEPCGQWVCAGTKVTCEPAKPSPGTACGACGSSKYACTAYGTTTCAMPDDRTVYEDAAFESHEQMLRTVDHAGEALVSWVVTRPLSYSDASLFLRRVPYACAKTATLPHPDPACSSCAAASGGGYDCTVPTPTAGAVTYTLFTGTPATGLSPVGFGTIDATKIPTTAGFVTIAFPAEIPFKPIGSALSLGLSTDSTAWAFEVYGQDGTALPKPPVTTTWWHRSIAPAGAWIEEPSTDLAHVVRGKACAP